MNPDKTEWIEPKNDNYFLPAAVIADLFKKKFLVRLRYLYNFNFNKLNLNFNNRFKNKTYWNKFISKLYDKQWNVKVTNPYIKPETVIDYFGRYSHKVAISNFRITKLENDYVYFRTRNSKKNKFEITRLTAVEFIRRFLLHILPKRFPKIRAYGIFSNSVIRKNIDICKKILFYSITVFSEIYEVLKNKTSELLSFFCNFKQYKCPKCKNGNLIVIKFFRCGQNPLLI